MAASTFLMTQSETKKLEEVEKKFYASPKIIRVIK
jgi:hypothetical protein